MSNPSGQPQVAPTPPLTPVVSDAAPLTATQLADTVLLHQISAELINQEDGDVIYRKLVDAAMAIMRSEFGSLQVLETGAHGPQLRLMVARGFPEEAERFWSLVRSDSSCACGAALRKGGRVMSSDILADAVASDEDLAMYRRVGMVAVQCTPLLTRSGRLLGMLATHWRSGYEPSADQFRLFDILVRQAADLLERSQTDAQLREREAWMAGQKEAMQAAMDGAPLAVSLGVLVRTATEQLDDGVRAAFYLSDAQGETLNHIVGMGDAYAEAVNGLRIGPESLACGIATATGEPVLTADVREDPRWEPWLWLAERFGYRACWSFPIHTAAGTFVGTFALYWPTPCEATPRHIELVGRVTQTAAIIISRDIEATARRRTAAALRESEAALRDAARRKDEFLAMLAHELRNPIAAIRNASYLLLNSPDALATARCSALIDRQVTLLTDLVNDLLDVSRITRGLITLRQEPCDLQSIVDNALASLQPMIAGKCHELEFAATAQPVQVLGDAGRLEQIALNLVGNAVKYTDPGGRIRVEGGDAELRVSDNGIGMSPDVAGRVFDLFAQAERGLARSQGGLGVGLTIVRQLVELHGGTVRAHSSGPGEGSEFVVRLPLVSRDAVHDDAPSEPAHAGALAARRILVVDDREDYADSLAALLDIQGAQVRTARNGAGALDLVARWRPDIVLLDLGLPDIDGFEVARRIRLAPGGDAVHLVAISGYGQPDDVQHARDAGFDRHFIKPVDIPDLMQWLQASARTRSNAAVS
ncbi:hybrid sensor histidine kinase/response regulator [Lysobacter auxotrophicus]|uniref:histidine kinase n=1 Tax=Lysobacter auxotrophicus TaxID=2992573 RepID=A0ABN6UMS4_9GAMM|nr:ATP-binding protein [Lysobacter auxotrophicus]BDU17708.1 ATP-binding protein [Lysobacter auxotrophicus]